MESRTPPTVVALWDRKVKKTRKPWRCDDCGKEFPAGTPKDSCGYKVDGEMEVSVTCPGRACLQAQFAKDELNDCPY